MIEDSFGQKAEEQKLPMQPGELPMTCANVAPLIVDVGFKPETSIEDRVVRFVDWYRWYYERVN